MSTPPDAQLVDVGGPILERREVGRDVVLLCRGLPVASFQGGDSIGRDVAVATLIRVDEGLKTDTIWFGLDGHFKAYSGDEPIDKGWDSKRRLASKGIADVFVTDADGFTWATYPVAVGSSLSQHLGETASALRQLLGNGHPIVVTFDRGGFDFDVLDTLDQAGFHYVGYVPSSVSLPDLAAIAPAEDGVGEVIYRGAPPGATGSVTTTCDTVNPGGHTCQDLRASARQPREPSHPRQR